MPAIVAHNTFIPIQNQIILKKKKKKTWAI